jgi:hypothetical protein
MIRKAMTALILTACLATTAGAQAPDMEHGRGKPQEAQRGRGLHGLLALLAPADAEVEVTKVDHGVELTLTAEDPEKAAALQEQIEEAAADLRTMAERLARWRERRPDAPMPRGLPAMLAEGEVELSVVRVEGGSVVQLLADDERKAAEIQENIPQWVENARRHRERMTEHYRRASIEAEVRRMVAEGVVTIEMEETADGVNVRFLTDDPEVARKLQRALPRYFESLTNPDTETRRPVRGNRDREAEDVD